MGPLRSARDHREIRNYYPRLKTKAVELGTLARMLDASIMDYLQCWSQSRILSGVHEVASSVPCDTATSELKMFMPILDKAVLDIERRTGAMSRRVEYISERVNAVARAADYELHL